MFMGRFTVAACVLIGPVLASAQMTVTRPAFEVASIRPARPSDRMIEGLSPEDFFQSRTPGSGMRVDGNRVSMTNRSVRSLIATAYRIRLDQVSGPPWLADTRFDVNATIPEDAVVS